MKQIFWLIGCLANQNLWNIFIADSLPYMQAVIMEVQRLANLVPIAGRANMEDTTLNGFDIPAYTTIMPNLYAVHMNPELFPNPQKFDPNRFLDAAGKIKKVEGFMPFSIGTFSLRHTVERVQLVGTCQPYNIF